MSTEGKDKEKISKNIYKLYLFQFIRQMMLIMPIVTVFFQENGLSMGDIFMIQAIFSVTIIILEIPSGYASDKLGHRRSLLLGSIVATIGTIIYANAFGFWSILLAEIVLGIGYAFFSGTDSAILYNSLIATGREEEHKKIESRLMSIGSFSAAFGGIVGGFLAAIYLRAPFIAEAFVMTLTIPLAFSLTEPFAYKTKNKAQSIFADLLRIVKYSLSGHKQLKWIIVYAGVINTSTLVFVWFMQPYWQMVDIPIAWFGILWAVLNISVGIFAPLAVQFENIFGLRKALASFVILVSLTYSILGLFPSLYIVPIILVFYFVRAVQQPILRDYVHKIIESDIRATVLSVKNLIGRLMFVILGPFLGYISDAFSLTQALLLSAIIFLCIGCLALFFLHKHKAF